MYCMNCGQSLSADARSCEKCGVVQQDEGGRHFGNASSATAPHSVRGSAFGGVQLSGLEFDAKRLSRGDMLAGGASLLLLLSLFLPWFHVQTEFAGISVPVPGLTRSGLGAHGWLFVVLLSSLAVVAYVAARAFAVQLPIAAAHGRVLGLGTGIGLILTLLGFIDKPAGFGLSLGAFIGMLAALGAVAGAGLVRSDGERVAVSTMPPPTMPPPTTPPPTMPAPSVAPGAHACAACGQDNPAGMRFCRGCGDSLTGASQTPSPS